jgi:2-phosphoglycerate kinase
MAAEPPVRTTDAEALRTRLRHVYWIGGGSGAGKSTVARRLAERYGLKLCSTDDMMTDHAGRMTPDDSPSLRQFAAMDMDERWANRTPEAMLDTFHWFRGEGFGLVVEDLLALGEEPAVVVEGFRLLPHRVRPHLADPDHAVWLLPTPEFRRAAFESRGTLWDIPNRTSDPGRAQHNLLERDRMFTDRLRAETEALGLPAVELDTGTTEDDLVDQVARLFGLRATDHRPSTSDGRSKTHRHGSGPN